MKSLPSQGQRPKPMQYIFNGERQNVNMCDWIIEAIQYFKYNPQLACRIHELVK